MAHRGSGSRTTARGRERRELIIDAAISLFHARGYHATGIDDIGAAAGITGPGVYRHFTSKDEILMTIFDRIWLTLRASIDEARGRPPEEALALLIDTHVRLVIDNRPTLSLLLKELQSLPRDYRDKVRRNESVYRDAWADAIMTGRQHLDMSEARIAARSCFWMINSLDDEPSIDAIEPVRAGALLTSMVLGAVESL